MGLLQVHDFGAVFQQPVSLEGVEDGLGGAGTLIHAQARLGADRDLRYGSFAFGELRCDEAHVLSHLLSAY